MKVILLVAGLMVAALIGCSRSATAAETTPSQRLGELMVPDHVSALAELPPEVQQSLREHRALLCAGLARAYGMEMTEAEQAVALRFLQSPSGSRFLTASGAHSGLGRSDDAPVVGAPAERLSEFMLPADQAARAGIRPEVLPQHRAALAESYARFMSIDDQAAAIEFLESPVGQKFMQTTWDACAALGHAAVAPAGGPSQITALKEVVATQKRAIEANDRTIEALQRQAHRNDTSAAVPADTQP